jgi:hypothetical protein
MSGSCEEINLRRRKSEEGKQNRIIIKLTDAVQWNQIQNE